MRRFYVLLLVILLVADVALVSGQEPRVESLVPGITIKRLPVTLDKDGNLYFSLGCMSYNKAWRIDKNGESRYDKQSERGAIVKVSPDRKHREVIASGLRFVIGLEFNKHGRTESSSGQTIGKATRS